jgi:hypothetical protein
MAKAEGQEQGSQAVDAGAERLASGHRGLFLLPNLPVEI